VWPKIKLVNSMKHVETIARPMFPNPIKIIVTYSTEKGPHNVVLRLL